jgi:hypothetical protein
MLLKMVEMAAREVLQTKAGSEPERDPGVSPNVILRKKKARGRILIGLRRSHTQDFKLILRSVFDTGWSCVDWRLAHRKAYAFTR